MVDQIGEFLKETERNTNNELPTSLVEILKAAPEQDNAPRELVEWIRQVLIEERHLQYDSWSTVSNLMRTIAIRNYYSPVQYERARERAGLELSNRDNRKQINRKLQKLTN